MARLAVRGLEEPDELVGDGFWREARGEVPGGCDLDHAEMGRRGRPRGTHPPFTRRLAVVIRAGRGTETVIRVSADGSVGVGLSDSPACCASCSATATFGAHASKTPAADRAANSSSVAASSIMVRAASDNLSSANASATRIA